MPVWLAIVIGVSGFVVSAYVIIGSRRGLRTNRMMELELDQVLSPSRQSPHVEFMEPRKRL